VLHYSEYWPALIVIIIVNKIHQSASFIVIGGFGSSWGHINCLLIFLFLLCTREHIQISASGHNDANQSIAIILVPNEMELVMNQTTSLGQFTKVIQSWLISVGVYQEVEIVGKPTLQTKIKSSNVYVIRSKAWMIEFSTHKQTGKDQLFIAVLYLVFLKCLKKHDQQTPSSKIPNWKQYLAIMKHFCIK